MIARLTWYWVLPLLKLGNMQHLEIEDLYPIGTKNTARYLMEQYTNGPPGERLVPAAKRLFLWRGIRASFAEVVYWGCKVSQAFALKEFVLFLNDEDSPDSKGYGIMVALSILSLCLGILHHLYFFSMNIIGADLKIMLNGLVYDKMLRVRSTALGQTTMGEIINLISNDTFKMEFSMPFWPFVVLGPVLSLLTLSLLIHEIGVSAVFGYLAFLLLIPIQFWFSHRFASIRSETAKYTDDRVKVIKEILAGSQVVKLYNWEKPLERKIEEARSKEVESILRASMLKAINLAIFFLAVLVPSSIIFISEVAMGRALRPASIFAVLALLDSLRLPIGYFFPLGIMGLSEARIGFQRIQRVLDLDEAEPQRAEHGTEHSIVEFSDATLTWSDDLTPCLRNVSVCLPKGKLVMVVGSIGSSKSSFLQSILQETRLVSGSFALRADTVAYTAQSPWIFAGSIRDNILFSRPLDEARYWNVIRACQLETDLNALSHRDETLIGERGVTLSGGQKARVALARALYSDSDLFLFDDPLSAVDALVGSAIMNRCFSFKGLLQNRSRILVTHQTQFLHNADIIIYLQEGRVVFQGSYAELQANAVLWDGLASARDEEEEHRVQSNGVEAMTDTEPSAVIEEEDRVKGSVSWRIYIALAKATKSWIAVVALFLMLSAGQVFAIMADWYVSNEWATDSFRDQREPYHMLYYGGIVLLTIVIAVVRAIFFFFLFLKAAVNLHQDMFTGVLYSPMRFFESNPVGRILNRFSKDQAAIDEMLPASLYDCLQAGMLWVSACILILVTNPWTLLGIMLLAPVFYRIQSLFLASSREIKRLEAVSKSPVFSHFAATLDGRATILAFGGQASFRNRFLDLVDTNNKAWIAYLYTSRWIGLNLDAMTSFVVFVTSFAGIMAKGSVDGATIGLSLAYALRLADSLQWCIRQSAEVENFMTSTERIMSYSTLEPEEKIVVEAGPSSWPQSGSIEVDHLYLRYGSSPYVISDVSLTIASCEKVGICGRTGAGKSTLFASFFRLLSYDRGTIRIDGVDIASLPLGQLRSALSIIPQDPILFSGTLRYNLDPFHLATDDAVWEALRVVQLAAFAKAHPLGLELPITEYGSNISQGEGQLMCVARALLKPSKILFVDEGTSSVDQSTDRILQTVIRDKFRDRTVITIAHRLNTIIDYDKIGVLDQGRLVQFGAPAALLADQAGAFSAMARESGLCDPFT